MKTIVGDNQIEQNLEYWEWKEETDEDLDFEGTIEC